MEQLVWLVLSGLLLAGLIVLLGLLVVFVVQLVGFWLGWSDD